MQISWISVMLWIPFIHRHPKADIKADGAIKSVPESKQAIIDSFDLVYGNDEPYDIHTDTCGSCSGNSCTVQPGSYELYRKIYRNGDIEGYRL